MKANVVPRKYLCFDSVLLVSLVGSLLLCTSGCATDDLPVTDGVHRELPPAGTRTVIWGDHTGAVGTATTWLLKRGLIVVERAKLEQLLKEQEITLTHTPDDNADVLRVGQLLGAQHLIFVDTKITPTEFAAGNYVGPNPFMASPGHGSSFKETLFNVGISVRGVDVVSGEVLWSGAGHYPGPAPNVDRGVATLTCHTLATVWGLRPSGSGVTRADTCESY